MPGSSGPYVGRFAPSPTGPLHAGSLVAALASWLDARAHGGRWLVRIEDVDTERCIDGMDHVILQQLVSCGLHPDEEPWRQSQRGRFYERALLALIERSRAYPCACSRSEIEAELQRLGRGKTRNGELIYPGTCRPARDPETGKLTGGLQGRPVRSWRMRTPTGVLLWHDRRLGEQRQDVQAEVGDFVLKRADGHWAYQLAVVVDDVAQGVTHIVRGEDLADNTPRQILLLQSLGQSLPTYMHTPLVLAANGEKLSKQNGAEPLDVGSESAALAALNAAAKVLGLPEQNRAISNIGIALMAWVQVWRDKWVTVKR